MSASASEARARRAGFSLLEMMIAVAIFAVVVVLFASTFQESTDTGKVVTVDAELRARAQGAVARLVQDLRSTRSSAVTLSTGSPRKVSFYPIIGTTSTSPYVVLANTSTVYSWDPARTTGTASWMLSQLVLTPYDKANLPVGLTGEVTYFHVQALGTTATSSFTSASPQTFRIWLQLRRRGVFKPTPANPQGDVQLMVTTDVTVQAG